MDLVWGVVATTFLLSMLALRLFEPPSAWLASRFRSPGTRRTWARRTSAALWIGGSVVLIAGLSWSLCCTTITSFFQPLPFWVYYGEIYVSLAGGAGIFLSASLWRRVGRLPSPTTPGSHGTSDDRRL